MADPNLELDSASSSGDATDLLGRNIAQIESGGQKNPYEALGPTVPGRGQAIGKYQVMPENVASWTQAAMGRSMTPEEFRADPTAQEAVFRDQMQRNLQQGYSPRDAASIWFTGRPYSQAGGGATDRYTTNAAYVAQATAGIPGLKNPPAPGDGLNEAIRNRQPGSTPYRISPIREHTSFGQPNDLPPPPAHEIPNIFNSIGGWFSQTNIGSSMSQILGRQSKEKTDQWWHEFSGQRAANDAHALAMQRLRYGEMTAANRALDEQIKTELVDYSTAMQGDPKTISQRLWDVANKYGDDNLKYYLRSNKVQDGLDYLKKRDQLWQDLNKSNTQIQKIDQIDQNQAPAYEPDDSSNLAQPPKPGAPGTSGAAPAEGSPETDPFAAHQLGTAPVTVAPLDGGPDGAGAPAQQQPPAPAPPSDAAPTQAPYELPGVQDTPSGQSGADFVPSIAPESIGQGAIQPTQGIQVAEAGMSDAPPSWASKIPDLQNTQTAQAAAAVAADQGYEWTAPPDDLMDPKNARTANGRILRNRGYIMNYALQGLEDPASLDRLYKSQPDVANKANQMANQIRSNLRSIAADPHPGGPWVIKAINSQVPGLGDEVKQVADGSRPPPGMGQQYGTRSPHAKIVASLVGKYDPTMLNPGIYAMRNKALQYWSTGQGGQLMLAQGTAYLHGFALLDSLDKVKDMGPLSRMMAQYYSPDWMKGRVTPTDEQSKAMYELVQNANVFRHEAEAVLNKGRPTVAGVKEQQQEFNLDWGRPEGLRHAVETMISRLKDKMGENVMLFHAGTGRGAADLDRLFQSYASQGNSPQAQQAKQVQHAISDMLNSGSTAPRGQAPAPSSGPQPGAVEDGWRFRGGDPGDQSNWERVQ